MEMEHMLKSYGAIHAGYLLTKSERSLYRARIWVSRFFILSKDCLQYKHSHDREMDPVTVFVDLDDLSRCQLNPDEPKSFILLLKSGQLIVLTAPSPGDASEWVNSIKRAKDVFDITYANELKPDHSADIIGDDVDISLGDFESRSSTGRASLISRAKQKFLHYFSRLRGYERV
eukprot:Rmarinus@m.446